MEQIISNLLMPDNEIIQQATKDLREAYKRPEAITELCNVAVNSQSVQVRQYSFVLLRRRLCKLRTWQLVQKDVQENIKVGMLKALVGEPEKPVRTAISQFIGILARHEFPKKDPWANDLLKFVFESCASPDSHLSEVGSFALTVITEVAPDQLLPHAESICGMFLAAITASDANGNVMTPVVYNILCALANLAPFIQEEGSLKSAYQNLIPYMVKTLQVYAINDTAKFIVAFDVLENIAENLPALLTPHLAQLVEFSLELARSPQVEEACRVKGVTFLGWLVRLKKKAIIKMKLIEPIVGVLFELMACAPAEEDDDEEEDYFLGNSDVSSPMTSATQTMDILALHVPPEKLIPPLLQLVEPAVKGDDVLRKKAAYLAVAVIAEGCSEAICTKYLAPMLECVKAGITNPNALVRNAALFALGQFAEHLQPEISQYANDILPILFEFLHQLCVQLRIDGKEPKHIDRMFYALETFCENLEDALVPYLPIFMERLFEALNPSNSVHLRELAMSCIGSAVTATKGNMAPYFNQVIEMLKMYLVNSQDENIVALRPSAIDTLAAVAQNIGKEHFLPLAQDSLNYGLQLIAEGQEPELKRSCYSLFASIGEVMHQDMAPALPKIIECMLESVRSSEGLVPDYDEDEEEEEDDAAGNGIGGGDGDDEDIDIEQSDNEEDDDILNMAVENAYLDEKEEAIIALRELALNTEAAFAPYIQPAFEEVYKLIGYPQEDIRRVCVEALSQFVMSWYKLQNVEGTKTALAILIPKLSELIRTDEERIVVKASLDAYAELLDALKGDLFMEEAYKDVIYSCIDDVLNGKVACQFDEPIVDDEEEESEFDEAVIETAGDILPRLGKAMQPQEFAMYFGRLFNYFMAKLQKSKKNEEAESQRAVVIGVISECFAGLKERAVTWMPTLLPILLDGVNDRSDMVRNNAVYGLGELLLHVDAEGFKYFPQALQALSVAVGKEKDSNTLDNICGALARLIIANSTLVPLKEVLPVFIQYLPLRQDFDENMSVFRCLHLVYQQGNPVIAELMEKVILIALSVLMKKQHSNDEVRGFIFDFVKQMRQDFSGQFNAVVTNNPEIAAFVVQL